MSIIFSCNYLKELEDLILENKVDVDFVKYPSIKIDDNALREALNLRPVLFHGIGTGYNSICTRDFIKRFDIEDLKGILKQTGSTYLSDHITATLKQFPEFLIDDVNGTYDELLSLAVKNIEYVKSNFNIPLVLENTVYAPDDIDILKTVTETKFINDLIKRTDTKFLLDTSHARTSAYNRGISFDKYLSELPLDVLYEVHLSGITMNGDKMEPNHTKMNEEDYYLLEYLLKNTPVKFVTLEYGPIGYVEYEKSDDKFREELYEQIIRISEIIRKY